MSDTAVWSILPAVRRDSAAIATLAENRGRSAIASATGRTIEMPREMDARTLQAVVACKGLSEYVIGSSWLIGCDVCSWIPTSRSDGTFALRFRRVGPIGTYEHRRGNRVSPICPCFMHFNSTRWARNLHEESKTPGETQFLIVTLSTCPLQYP